jgi:putative ABC transport system substrate-binding protein
MSKSFHEHPLFNNLSWQQIDRLACCGRTRIVNRHTILAKGDPGSSMFGICKATFLARLLSSGGVMPPSSPSAKSSKTGGMTITQAPHPMYNPCSKRDIVREMLGRAEQHRMAVITRRQLTAGLGGVVTALPLAVHAQQPAMPVIGFLNSTSAADFPNDRLSAFRRGLNEAGFTEGRNVAIEFRFANGQSGRLPALAAGLVRQGVAAIVVNGAPLSAAMAATSTIPIVFVGGIDPVAQGFVSSLSRPSGNVTGVSSNRSALISKRLDLLHELLPNSTVIAVLLDLNGPAFEAQLQDVRAAARELRLQIVVAKATSKDDLDAAFTTILEAAADAVIVGSSALFVSQRRKLVTFAASHALPASYDGRDFVELGGLMSYDANVTDSYRRGGFFVGRILKGAKPSDIPIELPIKYDVVINLATGKALGIAVTSMLTRADEVVE